MEQMKEQSNQITLIKVHIHDPERWTVWTGDEPISEPNREPGDFVWNGRVIEDELGKALQFIGEPPEWVSREQRSEILQSAMAQALKCSEPPNDYSADDFIPL